MRDYLANKSYGIITSHTNIGYPSVSSVMWAGLVDKWSYDGIFDSPLWNYMAHVRLNQTVEDYTKWIFGTPQMVSRDYHVWVVHMDSEMLDSTFRKLCEHYLKRPGNE